MNRYRINDSAFPQCATIVSTHPAFRSKESLLGVSGTGTSHDAATATNVTATAVTAAIVAAATDAAAFVTAAYAVTVGAAGTDALALFDHAV